MTRRQTIMRSVAKDRRVCGANQRNIAEFAGITTSAVNQTVKAMLEEDYLYKQTDPSDKRHSNLYLNEKGEAIARRVYDRLDASDDAITAMLGAEKEAELIALLNGLAEFIRKDLS